MSHGNWLQLPLVFLAAAVLAVPLARYLRLGSILGYLVAGLLIGPAVLGLIPESTAIPEVAELGVVLMRLEVMMNHFLHGPRTAELHGFSNDSKNIHSRSVVLAICDRPMWMHAPFRTAWGVERGRLGRDATWPLPLFFGSSPLTRAGSSMSARRPPTVGSSPPTWGGRLQPVRSSAPRGSSPLTRGGRGVGACRGRPDGIIPAHAGRASSGSAKCVPARDHPRSRGAGQGSMQDPSLAVGSSPLTRGGRHYRRRSPRRRGIIPAHSGRARDAAISSIAARDHPRSRGAGGQLMSRTCCVTGSSPLTRGGRYSADAALPVRGIIPAHAGRA